MSEIEGRRPDVLGLKVVERGWGGRDEEFEVWMGWGEDRVGEGEVGRGRREGVGDDRDGEEGGEGGFEDWPGKRRERKGRRGFSELEWALVWM